MSEPTPIGPSSERRSASDGARDRATARDVAPGLVVLVAAQLGLAALDPNGETTPAVVALTILSIMAVGWMVRAQVRSLQRADELQRSVQLEALAIGFGAFFLLAMVGGMLDGAGIGSSTQWLQITFIGGTLTWIAALGILTVRTVRSR